MIINIIKAMAKPQLNMIIQRILKFNEMAHA